MNNFGSNLNLDNFSRMHYKRWRHQDHVKRCILTGWATDIASFYLKGYSSGQSHFSEINVKLAEKNKYATHSVQRSLEMCENKQKPSVSEDFYQ